MEFVPYKFKYAQYPHLQNDNVTMCYSYRYPGFSGWFFNLYKMNPITRRVISVEMIGDDEIDVEVGSPIRAPLLSSESVESAYNAILNQLELEPNNYISTDATPEPSNSLESIYQELKDRLYLVEGEIIDPSMCDPSIFKATDPDVWLVLNFNNILKQTASQYNKSFFKRSGFGSAKEFNKFFYEFDEKFTLLQKWWNCTRSEDQHVNISFCPLEDYSEEFSKTIYILSIRISGPGREALGARLMHLHNDYFAPGLTYVISPKMVIE